MLRDSVHDVSRGMLLRNIVTAVLILCAGALRAAPSPTTLTLWPGYIIELPAGHCVELSRGPDFDVLYFRDQGAPNAPILAGIYAGHNAKELECAKATARQWNANGLAFKSVRASDGVPSSSSETARRHREGFSTSGSGLLPRIIRRGRKASWPRFGKRRCRCLAPTTSRPASERCEWRRQATP